MKKRSIKAILATALSVLLLCGCADIMNKTPVPPDSVTSGEITAGQPDASSAHTSEFSQVTEPTPVSSSTNSSDSSTPRAASGSSTPQSTSGSSTPQSTSGSSAPQSASGSSAPQSTSGSSAPQSTSSSSKPQSTSSSSKPQSTSSSSKPQSSSSSSKPQSTSSSSTPQSTSSSSTTQSTSDTYDQPIIEPITDGSILNNYTLKWAYSQITDKQRQLYSRLYNTASNMGGYCDISDLGLTADDIFTAYWAFDYDNPQFLELGSGYRYSYTESGSVVKMVGITIEYGRTSGNVPQSDFDRIAQGVLANARAKSSDYDKLKYFHDWIINNTAYIKADTLYESEADGPVVYGKAICEGYAKAFMYFAQSLGFECVCAIGSADGVDHMWNMVKLNGNWYHVDTTWDDPVRSDGVQTLRYDYFLLSDSEIRRDHSFASPFTLPAAPYSYA